MSHQNDITKAAATLIQLVHAAEERKGANAGEMELILTLTRRSGRREEWRVALARTDGESEQRLRDAAPQLLEALLLIREHRPENWDDSDTEEERCHRDAWAAVDEAIIAAMNE